MLHSHLRGQLFLRQAVLFSICFYLIGKIWKDVQSKRNLDRFIAFVSSRQAFCRPLSGGANRPLQGTNELVRTASSRSRGESMMRQPTTPAALHPNPMHMGG